MHILLSIKPEFVEKIFNGEKRFEFRKQIPKQNIDKVFVYASAPTQNIVGWFIVDRIISGHPVDVWKRCKQDSGIDEKRFYLYCGDKNMVHAFQIREIHKYEKPVDPFEEAENFVPPQNYMYLHNSHPFDEISESAQ